MFALYSEIERGKKEENNGFPNIMDMLNNTSGKISDLGPNQSINNVYYINGNNFRDSKKQPKKGIHQNPLYSENNMAAIKEELKEESLKRRDVKGM